MSIEKLKSIITRIRQEDTRWDAILELKNLNEPATVDYLMSFLGDRDWVVRWCVAEKLGDMGNPKAIVLLLERLKDPDYHVRKTAVKALEKFGRTGLAAVVKQFSNPSPEVRTQIFSIITHFGPKAVLDLEALIDNENWIVANRIMHTIWTIHSPYTEEILLRSIFRKNVQKNAIMMLALLRSKKAIAHFLKIADEPSLKRCISEALKSMGPEITYPTLIRLVCMQNSPTSNSASDIIIKMGDPILKYLLKALTLPEGNKEKIITLIQKIGPAKIMPQISQLANENKEIRLLTKDLRAKFGDKDGLMSNIPGLSKLFN